MHLSALLNMEEASVPVLAQGVKGSRVHEIEAIEPQLLATGQPMAVGI